MANQKIREKRRANRMKKNIIAKQKAVELENEDIDEEDDALELESETEVVPDDEPEVVKELRKDYLEPYMGPTSFAEADAMHEAHEQAMKVREVTYTAEELVRNIIYRPDMSPENKGKAIAKVGSEFGERVKAVASHKMEKELDMDLLQLQAIVAMDSRHTSLFEKTMDLFRKSDVNSKAHTRQVLKETISSLENHDAPVRENIPALIKSAKDLGIGVSNSMLIEKDATGNWRAILFPTNNFRDRDGEIVSEAAHMEYVEWVNKNMDCAPVFATWHKPGTARENIMDFIGYEHGIMVTSLPLTENEAARLLKMQTQVDVGLSIGGVALERDGKDIITKYRMFEVSDLPLERAANPFTELQLISKEAQMDMKKYLSEMLGDEKRAEDILGKMALTQKQLRENGVEEKEVKTETPATDTKTETETPEAIPLGDLVERVAKELGMEQLSDQFAVIMEKAEKVDVLEALVKELVKSNEDKLVEMITPPAQKTFSWMEKRASQSDKTVLNEEKEEDKTLLKQKPEMWLSEATGTVAIQ